MTEDRIDVYSKVWSTISSFLVVLCFAWLAWCMSQTTVPWRGSIFFTRFLGYIFLMIALWVVYVSSAIVIQTLILRRPVARIYDDRIEFLVPRESRYEIVPYIDIASFNLSYTAGVPSISMKYLRRNGPNVSLNGETNPDISEVCVLMNERLTAYWSQPVLSECLDFGTVERRLVSRGVARSKFDFGSVVRPECMVLKHTRKGYTMTYIDECGSKLRRGFFKTETDACHALLAHFLREEARRKSAVYYA